MINLSSFIEYHARTSPDRAALVYDGGEISYAEFSKRIGALSGFLENQSIKEGDVVAVLMKNSPAFLEIAFAVSHLGAVFLPINFRLAEDEVNYICRNSGARLLFVDSEFETMNFGTQYVVVDDAAQRDTGRLSDGFSPVPRCHVKPDGLFRLMYTSGTTDRPKGVMHSYDNFYWKCIDHVFVLGLDQSTRLLVAGPLYHVGAFDLPGVAVLWQGGTMAILRDFDPQQALAAIDSQQLNSAWLAPIMTSMMLECDKRSQYDVSTLDWVIGGGERTPENRIREFSDYFKNARYIDAYGLTESCSGDTFMEAGREIEKIGSTGRTTPHVDVDIRDSDGASVAPGVDGEICLRGPKIFCGYWNDEEKTKESFFGDWFRTGDIGYLDEDGFLYLTDRKKDMIISGGENIASSEVERVIRELPQIFDVAVIGRPDPRWGEVPVAVIVLNESESLDADTLTNHCKQRLASFKVPRDVVQREILPRNPSGKILKRQLRAEMGN